MHRRSREIIKETANSIASSIINAAVDSLTEEKEGTNSFSNLAKWDSVVSTGSLLLDLSISGNRVKNGGIPGGVVVEFFGPEGSGKTGILAEIAASVQARGGDVLFQDPEGRFDKEYSNLLGIKLPEDKYTQPDTVKEMFNAINHWDPKPKKEGATNAVFVDSLAALSTDLEMKDDEGDKMGMRRAKEFSEGFRKICRVIAQRGWILVMSNQEREGTDGKKVAPGGRAIKFYSSLRVRVAPPMQNSKLKTSMKMPSGKEFERVFGIRSICEVKKSTIDDPFRQCPISIVFRYGVDDIRDNLQFIKDYLGEKRYWVGEGNNPIVSMEKAIKFVDENNLQSEIREKTNEYWRKIESDLAITRSRKERS